MTAPADPMAAGISIKPAFHPLCMEEHYHLRIVSPSLGLEAQKMQSELTFGTSICFERTLQR